MDVPEQFQLSLLHQIDHGIVEFNSVPHALLVTLSFSIADVNHQIINVMKTNDDDETQTCPHIKFKDYSVNLCFSNSRLCS